MQWLSVSVTLHSQDKEVNVISCLVKAVQQLVTSARLVLQVLHCALWMDTVAFPVTVTQQSPAAVSMDTYQITTAPTVAKVLKHFCRSYTGAPVSKTYESVRESFALSLKCETLETESLCSRNEVWNVIFCRTSTDVLHCVVEAATRSCCSLFEQRAVIIH